MKEVTNRITQYPRRFKFVKVEGTEDTYDLVPVTGEIIQEGTPLDKELFDSIQADLDTKADNTKILSQVVRSDFQTQELSQLNRNIARANISVPISRVFKMSRSQKKLLFSWDKSGTTYKQVTLTLRILGDGNYGGAMTSVYTVGCEFGHIFGYSIIANNIAFRTGIYVYDDGTKFRLYAETKNFVDTCSIIVENDFTYHDERVDTIIDFKDEVVDSFVGDKIYSNDSCPIFGNQPLMPAPVNPQWVEGTSGSLKLPSSGWYLVNVVFGDSEYTSGLFFWGNNGKSLVISTYEYTSSLTYKIEINKEGIILNPSGSTKSSVKYHKLA